MRFTNCYTFETCTRRIVFLRKHTDPSPNFGRQRGVIYLYHTTSLPQVPAGMPTQQRHHDTERRWTDAVE